MRLAWFDCFSGASGDMILGALLDAGLDLEALRADVAALGLGNVSLRREQVARAGIAGTRLHVEVAHGHDHGHSHGRHLGDILDLIASADLPERVKEHASRVFRRLGEAEAAVHGSDVESVHFHEVGAEDAIVDICGAAAGLARLGVDEVRFSRLAVGRGYVDCAHGRLPVPAPATTRLIQGCEIEAGVAEGELLTPTGAAILTTLGEQTAMPSMRATATGYGAGAREREGIPNLLRVWLGETADPAEADVVWVMETNVDDCSGEVLGHAMERLLAEGALDVFATPIQMKKSRPGVRLTVIAEPARLDALAEVLFRETSTFGVRYHEVRRTKLAREIVTVPTPHGPVRVKLGRRAGQVLTREPEYEDCRRLAQTTGLPLREIMRLARASAAGRD